MTISAYAIMFRINDRQHDPKQQTQLTAYFTDSATVQHFQYIIHFPTDNGKGLDPF